MGTKNMNKPRFGIFATIHFININLNINLYEFDE